MTGQSCGPSRTRPHTAATRRGPKAAQGAVTLARARTPARRSRRSRRRAPAARRSARRSRGTRASVPRRPVATGRRTRRTSERWRHSRRSRRAESKRAPLRAGAIAGVVSGSSGKGSDPAADPSLPQPRLARISAEHQPACVAAPAATEPATLARSLTVGQATSTPEIASGPQGRRPAFWPRQSRRSGSVRD